MSEIDNTVKAYIETLNIPQEKKDQLMATKPKSLADVSLWLENHKDEIKTDPSLINPFASGESAQPTKTQNAKNIKIFSPYSTSSSTSSSVIPDGLVDTDDASWGLAIERTAPAEEVAPVQSVHVSPPPPVQNQAPEFISPADKKLVAEESALNNIEESLNSALDVVMTQTNEEGIISKAYNSAKEYFDSNLSKSTVCRTIYAEERSLEILKKAQQGQLTREEYFHEKCDIAINLLCPAGDCSEQNKKYIEKFLQDKTPEELDSLIYNLKTMPFEQLDRLPQLASRSIEQGKELSKQVTTPSSREFGSPISFKDESGKIKNIIKPGSAKALVTFDEAYQWERGVKFSPENIEKYDNTLTEYSMAKMISGQAEDLHNTLGKKLSLVRSSNANGTAQETEIFEGQLKTELISTLRKMYGDDDEAINKALSELSESHVKFENGKFVNDGPFSLREGMLVTEISQNLINKIDTQAQKLLNGKTLGDYEKDLADSYTKAYGNKNAFELAQAFVLDQEEITQKVRTGVEIGGAVVMIGGMFIATPVMLTGAALGSFGGIGVEALNEGTRKDGMSDEVKSRLIKELSVNAALFAVGGAASKVDSTAKAFVLAKECPEIAACVASMGADATISLIGTMALTGEINIEGEGLSQLISLIAGHGKKLGNFGRSAKTKIKETYHSYVNNKHVRTSGTGTPKTASVDTPAKHIETIKNPNSTAEEVAEAVKNLRQKGYKYENNELVPLVDASDVSEVALGIRAEAEPFRASANSFIDRIAAATGAKSSYRMKGDFGVNSLEGKIKKEARASHQDQLLDAVNHTDPKSAMSRVFDLYGARFLAKDQEGIDKIYKELYESIERGEFIPDFITNYKGANGTPYFSKDQLLQLKALCDKMGYKDVQFPSLRFDDGAIIYSDGYTSAHVNGRIKVTDAHGNTTYMPTEMQIRTENIQEICDAIHIPYDVIENPEKNILASMTKEQKDLATPLVEKFKTMRGKDNPLKDKYYQYQTDYINAVKDNKSVLPQPKDYGLPEEVSIENILKLEKMMAAANKNVKKPVQTPHIDYAIGLKQRGKLTVDPEKMKAIKQDVEKLCRNANTPDEIAALKAKVSALGDSPQFTELHNMIEQRLKAINTRVLPEGVEPKVLKWQDLSPEEIAILKQAGIEPKMKDGEMEYPSTSDIHGVLRKPLTKYDTPAIMEARYRKATSGSLKLADVPDEIKDKIHMDILNQASTVPKERKLVIITGRCGAGKSTIVKQNGMRGNYMEMDADELIKPELPGFKEQSASYVHQASVQMNKQITMELMDDGTNLIVPTTGWGDYIAEIIEQAKNKGYTIELMHSNVSVENSCTRAISRYMQGEPLKDGSRMYRVVDPYAIEEGTYVDEVVDRFRNNIYIDKISVYDNNGKTIRLVEEIVK